MEFSKSVSELITALIEFVKHPIVLLVVFSGCLTSVYLSPEYRHISITLAVASGVGFVVNIIIVIFKRIIRFFPEYNLISWSTLDDHIVMNSDEIEWDGFMWIFCQPFNYPMFALYAKCKKCNVTTLCYEDYKKLKIKIKCPHCGFSKSYKGTSKSLLERVTNQYNTRSGK